MQPSTSYWPATSSPGCSFGANENLLPQLEQNPSTSPGVPSRLRPTGRSHEPQNRLPSATTGLASTAAAGSRAGTGGISTSPAPRCPRADRLLPARMRRLPVRPLPVRPLEDPEPAPPDGAEPAPPTGAEPGRAGGTGGRPGTEAVSGAAGAGTAASPQVSQYPPSIVPPQPGRVHVVAVVVMPAASVRRTPAPPAGRR